MIVAAWVMVPLPARATAVPQAAAEQIIVSPPQIHGNRRIPSETIRARLISKAKELTFTNLVTEIHSRIFKSQSQSQTEVNGQRR